MAQPDVMVTQPTSKVQRSLLGSQIADQLRRDILLGMIKPGTRLSQQPLCERFGTSRMPIRDALQALTHEGLLTTDRGQHTIVAPLSRADLIDSYLIEGMLAGMAATRASENATPDDLENLASLHDGMVAAAAVGNQASMAELNWTFHRSINRLARSRKLLTALKILSVDLPRNFLIEMPERAGHSNAEHEAIIEAMRHHEHKKVGSLMTDHIVGSGHGLVEHLTLQGLELQ
ncbi:GntR family transcriptional regulator [Dactylosporangium fulvum]|uniref:GntR family transcriptional regulator n=1 Tax=Dactylosporangium fulvum TaxID=53359 RepID=A0ABY5W837_9ACTN|nr:GntR family transcriptional regulator [Dactylosporangium fulvum]UWP85520.1 GntR family transcriptional regulator [Dactylosporangium fulvum]